MGERGQLEVKDEKESMPLVDMVTIVAEVYGMVCKRLWRHKSSGHKAYIDMYYCCTYM